MEYLHAHAIVFGLLVTALMGVTYLLYRVVDALYQNFLNFFRRFRGVE